jgi:hypothetical protein
MVAVNSVIGVTIGTVALVTFGPHAVVSMPSSTTDFPWQTVSKPTDRFVLVSWWVIAAILANFAVWRSRGLPRSTHARAKRWRCYFDAFLGIASCTICIAAITWQIDPVKVWQGIPAIGVVLGLAIAAAVFWIFQAARRTATLAAMPLLVVMLVYAIPAWIQLPGALRDPYHFQFTADEISAVAAGHFPLSDYIPQYSVLLGFPIAPVLRIVPSQAAMTTLAWLLFLQLVAVAIAVSLPVLLGGRRMAVPAILVVLAPVLANTLVGTSASTYFGVMPMRVVIPSVVILVGYLVIRHRCPPSLRRPARWLALGFVCGLASLNNPDYGLPVLVVVLVVLLVAIEGVKGKTISCSLVFVSAGFVFFGYWLIGLIFDRPVSWSYWIVFQQIFGASGFQDVPMAAFGLHIAIVALFVATSVLGFVLVRNASAGPKSFSYRQGVMLCLTGGWSLLTLPYFAGRSLPSTAIGGYAFSVGLVTASLLPLIQLSFRGLRASRSGQDRLYSGIAAAMGLVAIVGTTSGVSLWQEPSQYLTSLHVKTPLEYSPLSAELRNVSNLVDKPHNAKLREAISSGLVEQALPMASLWGISEHMNSGAIVSSSDYYRLSRFFTGAQCSGVWENGTAYLLVTPATASSFAKDHVCQSHFDFSKTEVFVDGPVKVVLLARRFQSRLPPAAGRW